MNRSHKFAFSHKVEHFKERTMHVLNVDFQIIKDPFVVSHKNSFATINDHHVLDVSIAD